MVSSSVSAVELPLLRNFPPAQFVTALCLMMACLGGTVGSVAVRAAWLWRVWVRGPGRPDQVIAAYALRLNSRAGTEGSTVSSLICDHWLILGSETLSISRCLNHWLQMASCCMPGRSSITLFTRTAKLDPGAHGARCAWAMAVHHAVGISRQRNSGYMPNRVNMAQGLSTLDPSLSHTHLYKERSRNKHTLHTPSGQPDGIALPYTTYRPQRWHAKGACVTPNEKERWWCTWTAIEWNAVNVKETD